MVDFSLFPIYGHHVVYITQYGAYMCQYYCSDEANYYRHPVDTILAHVRPAWVTHLLLSGGCGIYVVIFVPTLWLVPYAVVATSTSVASSISYSLDTHCTRSGPASCVMVVPVGAADSDLGG